MYLRVEMGFCSQIKLEAKLVVCRAIADVEIECGLAGSPCADIEHLLEAPEEEGSLC